MERKRKLELFETGPNGEGANGDAEGAGADAAINPYTGRPYTPRYYEILAGRKGKINNSFIN